MKWIKQNHAPQTWAMILFLALFVAASGGCTSYGVAKHSLQSGKSVGIVYFAPDVQFIKHIQKNGEEETVSKSPLPGAVPFPRFAEKMATRAREQLRKHFPDQKFSLIDPPTRTESFGTRGKSQVIDYGGISQDVLFVIQPEATAMDIQMKCSTEKMIREGDCDPGYHSEFSLKGKFFIRTAAGETLTSWELCQEDEESDFTENPTFSAIDENANARTLRELYDLEDMTEDMVDCSIDEIEDAIEETSEAEAEKPD